MLRRTVDIASSAGEEDVPFGPYRLERRLAVGGMSEVFLAHPREGTLPASRVVLKRLLPELVEDEDVRRAFLLEAKLHAAARHPNVVEFFECGSYAGEPYIAMEHVAGLDLFRLLRRLEIDRRLPGPPVACFIASELCAALDFVHALRDERGLPLGIVHRDVSPSNILLSSRGQVKLGDFGIARLARPSGEVASFALKGKHQYLAPEQVAGEAFDHRADIFALAVVLSEMLIGAPLFRGAGQLAVLLAIRDVRIEPLREIAHRLPPGLFHVLERALAKDPLARYATSAELGRALLPFVPNDRTAVQAELAALVGYASDTVSAARRLEGAVLEARAISRDPGRARSGEHPAQESPAEPGVVSAAAVRLLHEDGPAPSSRAPQSLGRRRTVPEASSSCRTRNTRGEIKELSVPKLIELLATNQVEAELEVDLGDGFQPLHRVPMLARYLRANTATTSRLQGPGVPDYAGRMPAQTIAEALVWILQGRETGALFAEDDRVPSTRTELYFDEGHLVHATSSEPSTLLGELLVARGVLERDELELAVLVMHNYNGRLGDTLIALGLVDPIQVFQAIRAQGRDRVAAIFGWRSGQLAFYRGVGARQLEFRLELDVPALLLAGCAAQRGEHAALAELQLREAERVEVCRPGPAWAGEVSWPGVLVALIDACARPKTLRELAEQLTRDEAAGSDAPGRARYGGRELLAGVDAGVAMGVLAVER